MSDPCVHVPTPAVGNRPRYVHVQRQASRNVGWRPYSHVMRSPRLVLLIVTFVALAGCGTSTVKPSDWVAHVCQSLGPWRSQINSLNATAQSEMATAKTAQDTRTHILALLGGGRKATEQARDAVKAAGVPDVDGGAVIEKRFVDSLTAAAAAYDHAYTSISALSLADADAFYAGVADAMKTLTDEYAKSGIDTDELVSPELQADFDKVAACR
jgi:hypothetical protein